MAKARITFDREIISGQNAKIKYENDETKGTLTASLDGTDSIISDDDLPPGQYKLTGYVELPNYNLDTSTQNVTLE